MYLAVSVPIRFILARGFDSISRGRRSLYVAVSSVTLSLASTWFPVIPFVVGALTLAGHPGGESLVISVPVVALSMGIENSCIDAILLRLVLRRTVNRRYAAVLVANIVNAATALILGLIWAIHYMPTFEAGLH